LYEKIQQYHIISDTAERKTWNKCLNHNAQPEQSHAQMGGCEWDLHLLTTESSMICGEMSGEYRSNIQLEAL
jgi:hypothetical protein